MDWLGSDIWVTWIVLGVVLLGVELFSGAAVFLMFGLAGFTAAAATVVGAPEAGQIAIFGSMSIVLLLFVRPRLAARIHNGPTIAVGAQRLVGQPAVVTVAVTQNTGQVRIADQLWSARPAADQLTFGVDDEVVIHRIDGATAFVARKEA